MLRSQPLFLVLAHHALNPPASEADMKAFRQLDGRDLGTNDLAGFQASASNMLHLLQAWQVVSDGKVRLPGIPELSARFVDIESCRDDIAAIFDNLTNPDHPHFIAGTVARFGPSGISIQPKSDTALGAAFARVFEAIRTGEKWGTCKRCQTAFMTKSLRREFCSGSCKTQDSVANRK